MPPIAIAPKPMVDPYGFANADAVRMILKNFGETERARQDDQIANDILGVIASGGENMAEELASVIQSRKVEFSEGIPGMLQKISSKFAGPSQIKTGMAGQMANQVTDPMFGLDRRYKEARIRQVERSGDNPKPPYERTGPEKAFDTDVGVLRNPKASPEQWKKARTRIGLNPAAQKEFPGGKDYSPLLEELKDIPREKRSGMSFIFPKDMVYGTEAYKKMIEAVLNNGVSNGFTEASIEADFNRWWDEQYEDSQNSINPYKSFGKRPGYGTKSAPAASAERPAAKQNNTKSPFPDYPDAFQENGVWKVMVDGTKYRIEE